MRSRSLSLLTACNERRIRRNVGEKASLNPLPFARGERTVALPSVPLDLSLGWNLELSRHSLSFLPFGSRTRGRWLFRFPSRFFRYARAEDVKRLEVFEEFVTKRNGKKNGRAGPRIVIVGRICAAIKRGHLSRWRVVCEILLKTLSTSIERERERRVWISWRARRYLISCHPV